MLGRRRPRGLRFRATFPPCGRHSVVRRFTPATAVISSTWPRTRPTSAGSRRSSPRHAEGRATARVELLKGALDLFRGDPLPEFRYQDFAREEIARLEGLRLAAIEERLGAELELGGHAAMLGELERLVALDPLRERLRGLLMTALYRCGRQADALSVYQQGRQLLAEELGLDPGPALRDLEQRILAQDPALGAPAVETVESPRLREERRTVTVLSCDIVDPAVAGRARDPEDYRALQKRRFKMISAELARFGGTIGAFVGDAVTAVFGAPIAHEDDPERAVRPRSRRET